MAEETRQMGPNILDRSRRRRARFEAGVKRTRDAIDGKRELIKTYEQLGMPDHQDVGKLRDEIKKLQQYYKAKTGDEYQDACKL
jgi:hypothetical protein